MKKLNSILTHWICIFLFISQVNASHLVGGEITYTCTSFPGIYNLNLTLYRDCTGPAQGACTGNCNSSCGYTVVISGAENACNGTVYSTRFLNLLSVSDVNYNSSCPSSKSICTNMGCVAPGSFSPGVEKYIFSGNINLGSTSGIPTSCCNIRIAFNECCRGDTSSGSNFYLETIINRCLSNSPCNSSPVFSNEPVILFCSGKPFIYNMGASDPDHDSLTYSLVPSYTSLGNSITYQAPYTYLTPFPYLGSNPSQQFPLGFHCDSSTGDIMFTPSFGSTGYFKGIMSVQVKQWKRISGVPTVIGTTTRDVQMWLQTCTSNNTPTLLTYPSNGNQPILNWTIAAGQTACFDIIAKDTDQTDTTYLSWNNSLASYGATLASNYVDSLRKINGPREDSKKFCWTPDSTKISNIPYYFTTSAKDNRCPYPGNFTKTFAIKVIPDFNIVISKSKNSCRNFQCSYSQTGTPQIVSSSSFTISNVANDYSLNNANVYSNAVTTPLLNLKQTGKFLIKFSATSNWGLTKIYYDTILVDTPTVNIHVDDTAICSGSNATFNYYGAGGVPPYSYRWFLPPDTFVNPLNTPFFTSNSFLLTPSTTTKYTLQIRDSKGCRAYDSPVTVTVNSLPVLTRPSPVQVCKSAKIVNMNSFATNPTGGTSVWSYPTSPGAVTGNQLRIDSLKSVPNDTINYTASTFFENWISYKYTAPPIAPAVYGCTSYDSASVRVFGNPYVVAGFDVRWCSSGGIFQLLYDATRNAPNNTWQPTPYDPNGQSSTWTGNGVDSTIVGSMKHYTFNPVKSGVVNLPSSNILTYAYTKQYTGTGAPSCIGTDTVKFDVIAAPVIKAGLPPPICSNSQAVNLTTYSGASIKIGGFPQGGGYWTYAPMVPPTAPKYGIDQAVKDSQNFDPTKVTVPNTPPPGSQYTWKIIYNDNSTGCFVSDTTSIIVVKSPTVKINLSPADATVCLNSKKVLVTTTVTPTGGNGIFSHSPYRSSTSFTPDTDPTKAYFNPGDASMTAGIYSLRYIYTVSVQSTSCTNIDSTPIIVEQPPRIIIATKGLSIDCRDSSLNFSLDFGNSWLSGYSFLWSHYGFGHWIGNYTSPILTYVCDRNKDFAIGSVKIVVTTTTNNSCPKDSDNTTLSLLRPPTPIISGPSVIVNTVTKNYFISNPWIGTYNWFITNGWISGGNGTDKINAFFYSPGTENLKVVDVLNSNCKSDTGFLSVSVLAGVSEFNPFEHFKIFPNPSSGILNIELTTDEKQIQIEVTDVLGKVVTVSKYNHTNGEFKTAIDLKNLNPGIYFVTVKAGDKSAVSRITLE